jgi:class 3 adenylate cyclase
MEAEPLRRRLAAILSADVAGYSRLMGEDEATTVADLAACRDLFARLVQQFHGRIVNAPGDARSRRAACLRCEPGASMGRSFASGEP